MRIQTILMTVALAGCGIDTEDAIDTDETGSASSVEQWTPSGAVTPTQRSVYQPGLAFFNGQLRMVHNGYGTPTQLYYSAFNGASWTADVPLSGITSNGGPSLIVHQGVMKMIYRVSNRILVRNYNGSGSSFGSPVTIGSNLGAETLRSEPATAELNGQLYVAYCTNQAMRIDPQNTNNTWTNVVRKVITGGYTCEHVEIAAIRDPSPYWLFYNLHVEYSRSHPSYSDLPLSELRSGDGTTWVASTAPAAYSAQPMSVADCNGLTHFIHGGDVTASGGYARIGWAERTGYTWGYDYTVPDKVSTAGAALGCFGARTIMVFPDDNDGDKLKWSEFGP
jgi:hypothetical protein